MAAPRRAGELLRQGGTRFRLFAVPRAMGGEPEVVEVAGAIGPGPEDALVRVVRPAGLKEPYKHEETLRTRWLPPYPGKRQPPLAARDGRFDHLEPGTDEFGAAAAFASVRAVLRVWTHYLGRPFGPWFFRDTHDKLELVPHILSTNAWSGQGFVEFGYRTRELEGPLCEEFDIVAHEAGHQILKTLYGSFSDERKTLAFRAHEEACADLVALIASLHFDSVVDTLLRESHGRLFSKNILSDIGGFRRLFDPARMDEEMRQRAWDTHDTYAYAMPFAGAAFDVLVEIFEEKLVAREGIPRELAGRSRHRPGQPVDEDDQRQLREDFRARYTARPAAFKDALLDARDDLGRLLAGAWMLVRVDGFSFPKAVANLLTVEKTLNGGKHAAIIRRAFEARGIRADPDARDLPPGSS
ncbi:MAG: hypothetical protein L0027_17160 [Candidatus Rokubacteria bacterium]|nr:hypothetical protein [Candidatus Rokubacteria bacterium]